MNKQTNKLIPELRFPEFVNEENWKEEELGNCLDYLQPTNYLVKSTVYDNKFKTPVLTAGKTFILGYTNEEDGVFSKKLPVIIFDDFTTATKYVNFPFKAKSSAMKILLSKDNTDIKFVYEIMQMLGYEVGVHERHWISIFSKIKIKIPKILEQQKIASCLSSLDEVINVHIDKLEILKTYKKGLMQNLFPQVGENVPKIRFKEFEKYNWEELELNKLGGLIGGLTYSPEDVRDKGLLVLRSSNIQNGQITLNDCVYVTPEIKGANICKEGDILICIRNGSRTLIGKNAIIPNNLIKATHGAFMTVFRAFNPKFVFQLFKTDLYNKQVNADLGPVINSINGGNLLKYKFTVPKNPDEQQKIADTLSSLDELIAAQVNKIEQLKSHKKGLMQGLFPKVKN
jgi:type I restriction enzyme, S subunit